MGFPSQREGFDWWSCRSRSHLSFPSNRCNNHVGIREKGSSRESRMVVKNMHKNLWKFGEEDPLDSPLTESYHQIFEMPRMAAWARPLRPAGLDRASRNISGKRTTKRTGTRELTPDRGQTTPGNWSGVAGLAGPADFSRIL
jgi:hypothetical protein